MERLGHRRTHLYFASFLAMSGAWWLWNQLDVFGGSTWCLFKTATGLPCPSCGTTRAFGHLINGNWGLAIATNPLGLLTIALLAYGGMVLSYDLLTGRNMLDRLFRSANAQLKRSTVFYPVIITILLNWFWNVSKGL